MIPKYAVCVTVKEYWVKEEWLIEVRYVTRVKQQISSENYLQTVNGNESFKKSDLVRGWFFGILTS